jgi:hypothetical protein
LTDFFLVCAAMPGGSSVWQEFKKLKEGEKLKAECMWCHHKLKGEAKYGTTHCMLILSVVSLGTNMLSSVCS